MSHPIRWCVSEVSGRRAVQHDLQEKFQLPMAQDIAQDLLFPHNYRYKCDVGRVVDHKECEHRAEG